MAGEWLTCKILGRFSRWASWVAIVDFPTHAVPHTRIISGSRWWWNLVLPNPLYSYKYYPLKVQIHFSVFLFQHKGRTTTILPSRNLWSINLYTLGLQLSKHNFTSLEISHIYQNIPGHHLVALNILCSISTPLHKLYLLPISLSCTMHLFHKNTIQIPWIVKQISDHSLPINNEVCHW